MTAAPKSIFANLSPGQSSAVWPESKLKQLTSMQ